VDPYADSLRQPIIRHGGLMEALDEEIGFGPMINKEWALSQKHDDPEKIFS
jgi:hypothetical protein